MGSGWPFMVSCPLAVKLLWLSGCRSKDCYNLWHDYNTLCSPASPLCLMVLCSTSTRSRKKQISFLMQELSDRSSDSSGFHLPGSRHCLCFSDLRRRPFSFFVFWFSQVNILCFLKTPDLLQDRQVIFKQNLPWHLSQGHLVTGRNRARSSALLDRSLQMLVSIYLPFCPLPNPCMGPFM